MKRRVCILFCMVLIGSGCTGAIALRSTDTKKELLDNLSGDLAGINLIAENARREFGTEPLNFHILDAWSLAKEKQFQKVGPSKAKIFTVLQTSVIEIPTSKKSITVEISKIRGEEQKFFGVTRPQQSGVFYSDAPLLAETGGYPILLYDPMLELDGEAVEAITRYVSLTARFEHTAKIIFQKMLEVQEKYKDAAVSIESFTIQLPILSLDIRFKVKP